MVATDKVFGGSIPDIYDRFLVPLIFHQYARDLAERIAATGPRDLLETAAGTGALTRALVSILPAHTRIVATDLNQPMIDHAAAKSAPPGRVTWRQADALSLPFADQEFDVVGCQFGVMFFPDRIAGYREARRVLKQRGRFFFSVWDRIIDNEFAETVTEAVAAIFPKDPPLFLARTPHGYCNIEQIREELSAAGLKDISVEAITHTSKAASPRDVAIAFCQGTPLRNEIAARDASRLDEAIEAAAEAIAKKYGRGQIEGRIKAVVVAATA